MQLSKERRLARMQVHAPSICSSTLVRYFVMLSSAVTISEMPYFLRACIRPASVFSDATSSRACEPGQRRRHQVCNCMCLRTWKDSGG